MGVSLKATRWYAVVDSGNQVYRFRLQSFKQALQVAIGNLIWRIILPDWVLGLYKKGKETRDSFKELGVYMQEMVQSREVERGLEQADLLSNLLHASATEDEGSMTDQDIMGELPTALSG